MKILDLTLLVATCLPIVIVLVGAVIQLYIREKRETEDDKYSEIGVC